MAHILPGSSLEANLYAITDSSLSLGRSTLDVVTQILHSGVRIIQYREKEKTAKEMLQECIAIRTITKKFDACFIVNDHIALAQICDADGVHLGQDDLPLTEVKKLLGDTKIIGISTHNPQQAQEAISNGADYIGVGPIYPTQTKKNVCAPVTLTYLDWVVENTKIPFVAIGGIKLHNISDVVQHGASCCALVSEIVGAEDIPQRITDLRNRMKQS